MIQRQFFLFFSLALLFSLPASANSVRIQAATDEHSCLATKGWPHEQSDLKPDPALTFGSLANGIRYAIMPNKEPKGRVALQLNIQTGSLNESEEQRGIAHYLEHMLFNGTVHHPPGTLIDYFQSIGMSFGPDTNAHTSYDETVYQLMLPNSERKTLSDGLLVLADYASGALLLPEEVERERGVVLAEKRERNSAALRVSKADMEQFFAGTLLARRDVIGVEEVLQKADAALLRQYYEQWYRPEHMIVVAVGDADPELLKELMAQHFGGTKAKTEPAACPDLGRLAEGGTKAFHQFEPDLGYVEVSIGSLWNSAKPPVTKAESLRNLLEYTAAVMMNNRLQRLVDREDSPMTKAGFSFGIVARQFRFSGMEARTTPEKWRASMELLDVSLRQALAFGFSQPELDRARNEILSMLREQVQSAASRKSDDLAGEIISSLNDNEVFVSPTQEMELFAPALEKMALAEVEAAFRSLWHAQRVVKVAGTADLRSEGRKPEEMVLAAFEAASQAELVPWTQEENIAFPYLPVPATQAVVEQHEAFGAVGMDRYRFSNGLILNLKKTDFEPNELRATISFGNGKLSEPKPGLSMLARRLVAESGLGRMDREQLKSALARYSSSVDFVVDEDSFQIFGKGLTSETELLFQLLHAHLNDPAFRKDAFGRVMRKLDQMYAQQRSSVEGMMNLQGEQFLAGGNQRYGIVPQEMIKQLTVDDVRNWLTPILQNEGLEISVVGDFNPDEVIKLVGRYFGDRRGPLAPQPAGQKIDFPAGKKLALDVATDSDKAKVVVAWATADYWDIVRTRRLSVLAAVLDDRLRKQIREKLGAAYSPFVYNDPSQVDPGHGVLRSEMVVDPAKAEQLAKLLRQTGAELAEGTAKVTAEELARTVEPFLTSIRDMLRTNQYWLGAVLVGSVRHPQQLTWSETIQQDYASVAPKDVEALAKQYLQAAKASEVVLLPKKKP